MKFPQDANNHILRTMFWEAGNSWNLARLYHDLEDIKGEPLTELELACLRGLLLYGDRQKVAGFLAINPETLREILNSSLYLYISKLTDTNNVTSRSIPKLIADRGYQLGSKKLLAIFKKFLPGTIATIFTGILVNLIVTQLTRQVDEPKLSPPCTKFENCQISKGLCVYGGSASWAPLRKLLEEKLLKTHPDFQLQYQDPFDAKPSSGRGVKMLIEGEIDIGLS